MFANTPLPEGPGGRSTKASVTALISPVPLSITPGPNSVSAVPAEERKSPSVTALACTMAGLKALAE